MLTETHVRGDLADQLPVRACLPGGRDGRLQQREVALGVDHDGVGLRPQGRGQYDVGVAVGRGRLVGVLGDDELGLLKPGDDCLPIRHGGNGIRADDPAGLDVAAGKPLEHLDGAGADIVADGARRARATVPRRTRGRPPTPPNAGRVNPVPCNPFRDHPSRWAGRSATSGRCPDGRSRRWPGEGCRSRWCSMCRGCSGSGPSSSSSSTPRRRRSCAPRFGCRPPGCR